MDATAGEIRVDCGDWMTATRRSSRPVKPTAKVQESAQPAASRAAMAKKTGAWPMGVVESAGEGPRPTEHAGREAESPTHTAFRTLLQEASARLMNEQKRILQRLWEALLENQESAMRIVSDQRDMIQQLQQDVYSIRVEAAKTAEEVKAMREANEQLRQQQEETIEELKQT